MALSDRSVSERELFLFDTFAGMTPASPVDVRFDGADAAGLVAAEPDRYLCDATLSEVQANFASTGYPVDRARFIVGPVENTIPAEAPAEIALLRLDTDWYESTLHELRHLYERIVPGGVILIDDYGFWRGARQACEEFFASLGRRPLLTAIDETGVVGVVVGSA
jgi:hypothetical protein